MSETKPVQEEVRYEVWGRVGGLAITVPTLREARHQAREFASDVKAFAPFRIIRVIETREEVT